MKVVLGSVLNTFCHVYLDITCIIIVTSATFTKHLQHLKLVFQHLQQVGLIFKMAKCQ